MMKIRGRYLNCALWVCGFLLGGLIFGGMASRWIVVSPKSSTQRLYLREKGDAPADVRAEVLQSLTEFQSGYSKRDLKQLDSFMQRLFPADQDTRVIGTDVGEWNNGYESIAQLVRADWLAWGDLNLAINDSVVDSSSGVAWLETTGTVSWARSSRSIRFTAVLTPRDGRWQFRQIVFQWDERAVTLSDLLGRDSRLRVHLR
jgi:hypothetical protein